MDGDYLQEGYAQEKEIKDLEERLAALKSELNEEGDSGHGRPRLSIENEILKIESKIHLLKTTQQEHE